VAKKTRRKNNRFAILLLPALVFIFFMGWSMYWINDSKKPVTRERVKRRIPKNDGVTFLPAVYEEPQKQWTNVNKCWSKQPQVAHSFEELNSLLYVWARTLCCCRCTITIPFILRRNSVILREIAIQEVHPCLAGHGWTSRGLPNPDKQVLILTRALGSAWAIRQACF